MQSTVVTRSHFWEWLSQCWCAMSEEPAAVVTLTRTDAIFVMELPEGEARFNPTSVAALPTRATHDRKARRKAGHDVCTAPLGFAYMIDHFQGCTYPTAPRHLSLLFVPV